MSSSLLWAFTIDTLSKQEYTRGISYQGGNNDMQNSLYRLHWIVERFGKAEDHFSFHKDDEVLGLFIKQVHETNADPNIRYKSLGAGCKVSAENGRIYDLVHNSKKLGFWDYELKSLKIA